MIAYPLNLPPRMLTSHLQTMARSSLGATGNLVRPLPTVIITDYAAVRVRKNVTNGMTNLKAERIDEQNPSQ